jgi:hypothetical protein
MLREKAPGVYDIPANTLVNMNGLTVRVIGTNTAIVGDDERAVNLVVHVEIVSKNDSKLHEWHGKEITVGDQHSLQAVIPKP